MYVSIHLLVQVQSVREVQRADSKRYMFEIIMTDGKKKMLVSHWGDVSVSAFFRYHFLQPNSLCVCLLAGRQQRQQVSEGGG